MRATEVRPSREHALWLWFGLVCLGSVLVLIHAIPISGFNVRAAGIALEAWLPASITMLGVLVAIRVPGFRIAWLLLGVGFSILVEFAVQLALLIAPAEESATVLISLVLSHVAFPSAMYLLFLITLLFPTGRFLSRGHAWAAVPGAVMLGLLSSIAVLSDTLGPPFPSTGRSWEVENPIGFLPVGLLEATIGLTLVSLVATALAGAATLTVRYRRSTVVEKAQIRWVLLSISFFGLALGPIVTTDLSRNALGAVLLGVAFVSIPLSITLAITRYRLFEIDRIISRTVTYAVVIAALGILYAAGVVWLPTALDLDDSPLLVAAATLLAAALFNPFRRLVQAAVDRRFNRAHFEAGLLLEQFADRIKRFESDQHLARVWLETVDSAFGPRSSGVWLRERPDSGAG